MNPVTTDEDVLLNGSLPKSPTGISGLDEITEGGLPLGRPTLISGGVGCGKTLFGIEFLVRGVLEYGEPGVLMTFEETPAELIANVRSLGFDLQRLIDAKQLSLLYVHIDRREIEETGEYDLEGLFVRLGYAIDTLGAKRVVLDTLESIFSGFDNEAILRAELRRLFHWLKERGVTSVITAESFGDRLSRHGLEEFLSDCVIRLERKVIDEVSTRRLEIVKFRGSGHGTNAYPFLIDRGGLSVLPITSLSLSHQVSRERVSSGSERLDEMLGGKGFFRGSSILISGTAGSGKSSLAVSAVDAACRRGERCLYFAFEESPDQIIRNMRSIGVDLQPWVDSGILRFQAARPTLYGLEMHLASIHRCIEEFQPSFVVLDPVTNFVMSGTQSQVKSMLMRLIDFLKTRHITGLFTSLTEPGDSLESSEAGVSSLIDTWLLLRFVESSGERNRTMYIPKSRGMSHSNQVREFIITSQGIELVDVYLGPSGVLTGAARYIQEARERTEAIARRQELEARERDLERQRLLMEAEISRMRANFESRQDEFRRRAAFHQRQEDARVTDRAELARLRYDFADESLGMTAPGGNDGDRRS